jgi:hypothetical protein
MRGSAQDAAGEAPAVGTREQSRTGTERRWRAAAAPIRVAAWRIARRPTRILLVAAGVALATASLVAVSAGSLVLRERTLRAALAEVPPEQLSFRTDEFGLSSAASPAAERTATRALGLLSGERAVHAVEFRPLRFERNLVDVTAVDGVGRFIQLRSGRLPRACRPARCEVLEIGSTPLPAVLRAPGVRVVPVGRASLTVPAVLGDFAEPSNATLLVSSDVRGLASLPALESIFRTGSWVVPLRPDSVHEWDVARLLAREAHAQALLEQFDPAFKLTAPDDAFATGRGQGRLGSRRMLLVGGEIAALLLGFALLASIGLRRTLLAEWRRLEERGARRAQLWLFLTAESGAAALAGAVAGIALGIAAAAWAANRASVGSGDVLRHGILTPTTFGLVGVTWIVATLVLVLAVRGGAGPRAGPVRLGDLVAVGALLAAVVAAARGGADASALAEDRGSVVLLLLFPGLVSLFAALLAQRLLAPLLRVAERGARGRSLSLRLALVSLSRAPARTSVAVAFLVVSVGLAVLAAGYRATLERGVRDEAAYQVPLDFAVTEGTQPVARLDTDAHVPVDVASTQGRQPVGPLDVATVARYRSLAPGVEAFPVLKRFGDVPGNGAEFTSPILLGVDPSALEAMHGWRSDFSHDSQQDVARLLGREPPVHLLGVELPARTTGFGLAAKEAGATVDLTLAIEKPSGEIVDVPLVAPGSPSSGLAQPLPARGRLVALELSLTPEAATAIAHSQAEGAVAGASPLGSIELGPLIAYSGARRLGVVTDWDGWIGRSGARRVRGTPVRVRYELAQAQTALFRPRQPTDGHPIPLVASADVARSAAPGGLVTIQNGEQHITGRIVGVASRFPGTADGDGSFVVADESHLQTALDADSPGTGRPLEVWLSVPSSEIAHVGAALTRPPFSPLVVASRRGLEHDLREAPLSRAIEIALAAGALVALALAVCGIWLTVIGDVADERGELYDLETQGMTPAELRSQLRLQVAILAALGVAGGVGLGLVLSSEVVRLLQVTASGTAPIPPLLRQVGWSSAALALVASAVLGAALVEATVRGAFRQPVPTRAGEVE